MTNRISTILKEAVIVAAAIGLVGAACRSTKQNLNKNVEESPATATSNSNSVQAVAESKLIDRDIPFNHNRKEHKTRDCKSCHQRFEKDEIPKFPSHSACIDCHQKDYTATTSRMCGVCHKTPLETQPQLAIFPARLVQFGIKGFSHKNHMDPAKTRDQMTIAATVDCQTCHKFDDRVIQAGFPNHQQCYSCHIHQAGGKFSACGDCHADTLVSVKYTHGMGTALSLYNFKHGPHIKKASCDRCHKTVELTAQQPSDILRISTARGLKHTSACWSCHVQARETVCTKCHVGSLPF
jgi:hypothetical protein